MDDRHEDNCKVAEKLLTIHRWTHRSLLALSKEELLEAHRIGHMILDLLNDEPAINAIKFLAIFEVLAMGADVMEEELSQGKSVRSIRTVN